MQKNTIKVSGKKQFPTSILTVNAETTMKKAAELRNDTNMIAAIANESLVAKEFKKHNRCYRDYTRVVSQDSNGESNLDKQYVYEKGDYDAVCKIIESEILENHKCVSMDVLLATYGIGTQLKVQYRSKLKNRLINTYGDSLLFLTSEYHLPQVVISKECLTSYEFSSKVEFSDQLYVQKAAKIIRKAVITKIDNSSDLPWPPTIKTLQRSDRGHPEILKQFYVDVLSD